MVVLWCYLCTILKRTKNILNLPYFVRFNVFCTFAVPLPTYTLKTFKIKDLYGYKS